MIKTSRLPGFYKLPIEKRLEKIKHLADLNDKEVNLLRKNGGLNEATADRMVENVIGSFPYPFSIATNFKINGKDYLVPMVIEETSVVAAASHAAKITRKSGGITAEASKSIMIGQIQLHDTNNPEKARSLILENKEELLEIANEQDPTLVKLGGGAKDLNVRIIDSIQGPMVITHLLVDCLDAMGANATNSMAEALAPYIEDLTDGTVNLRIISNLADKRLVRVKTMIKPEHIGGEDVVDGIVNAYAFAEADPYRAATHNKGIMNGIIGVLHATMNDTRAVEAGAHAFAAKTGSYKPLTTWKKDKEGNLVGNLEIPMAVGTVGGATKIHPLAQVALKILGTEKAQKLAEIAGSVGLAQNLAALRALATAGIQKGHMKLHAQNLAFMAGARGELIEEVVKKMRKEDTITFEKAKEFVKQLSE